MEEEKYSYATLKNEKGRMVYPKTRAEQVKYYDPDKKHLVTQSDINDELKPLIPKANDMEARLKSVEELTQSLKDNLKFKGVVDSEDKLPEPAEGENADGWFAIVTVSKGKDKWYIYDTEEGWLDKGEATTYIYEGVKVLNGKEPVEGALVINASDIVASINGESKTIQDVLTNLSNEQNDLANEVRTKNHVLYMTEYQMEQVDEIQEGQVVVCIEDGIYEKGATYKLVSGVWEKMIAVANTAQHLYGTLQEPIVLMDLEDGDYVIHNYLKVSTYGSASTYAIVDYNSLKNTSLSFAPEEVLMSVEISIKKENNASRDAKYVVIKNYSYIGYERNDILGISNMIYMYGTPYYRSDNAYNSVPKTSGFIISYYQTDFDPNAEINYDNFMGVFGQDFSSQTHRALSVDNTATYVPTEKYHPATKDYVDNAKPIQVVSDVETEANGINMFSTNREAGENSRLFMNKEVTEFVSFPLDEFIYNPCVKVDESIIDVVLPDGVILASTHLYGYFYKEDKTTFSYNDVALKVYFTDKKVSRVSWIRGNKEQNVYYKEQWTNEPILLNTFSGVSVNEYPYFKITPEEGTVNALIKDYVLLEQKKVVKEEVALMRAIGSGGTTITDTLTLSKEVFVPEIPEISEITISRMENPEAPEGMLPNNGFTLGDDGYYVNLNSYGSSTYSMCKIFFDVKEERDFILDVIYEGEQGCDFPMFGKIDTMLEFSDGWEYEENNDLLQESFREKGPSFNGEVVYKNVPAGEHFIVVKYRNDGGTQWNSDTVKFKSSEKNKGQEFVPSDSYTSQQEIKIGDHNNLQIEGKDILKDGDFEIPFKTIVGTEENPIMLLNLEKGSYKMSGWVQCSPNVEKGPIYTYNYMGEKTNIDAYVIVYPEISPDYKLIYIFNGNFSNYGIEISNYNYYNTLVGSYVVVNESGYGGGTSLDFGAYAQNWQLSEMQTQVTEKINSYRPIEEIDNPSDKNELEDKNKIFVNSNLEDNSLYFAKVINKEEEEKEVNAGEPIKGLVLNKNIINAKPNTTDSLQASIFQYDLFSDANCNNLLAGGLTIDAYFENGELTRIIDCWIGLDLYNKDSGWVTNGDNTDENEFNLTNYFHFQHFSNVNKIYVKIANIFTDYINTNDYLRDKNINYTVDTFRTSQVIDELEDPTNVTEKKYKNGFGTSTNVEDETLYYYKSTGTTNGEYQPLTTDVDYDGIYIDKNIASYYPQNGLGESVSLLKFNIKDESKNVLGSLTIVADISPVGELFKLHVLEADTQLYYNGVWTDEFIIGNYANIMSLVKMLSHYANAKYLSVESPVSQDTYPDIYNNCYTKYFVGEVKQAAVKPVRLALYSDLENAGGGAIKELVGTADKPINIYDDFTEFGYYLIKGFYRLNSAMGVYELRYTTTSGKIYDGYLMIHYFKFEGAKYYFVYGGKIYGNGLVVENSTLCEFSLRDGITWTNSENIYTLKKNVTEYTGSTYESAALTVNNGYAYEPTSEYHPATKGFVERTVAANKAVKVYDDPTAQTDANVVNSFGVSSSVTDNNLYIYKTAGYTEGKEAVAIGEKLDEIYLNKDILNYANSLPRKKVYFYAYKGGTNLRDCTLELVVSGGVITKVLIEDVEFYSTENGWSGLANENGLPVLEAFRQVYADNDNYNAADAIEFYFGEELITNVNYLYKLVMKPVIKAFKIALTEV